MTDAIGPGSAVVCIESAGREEQGLVLGKTYFIKGIIPDGGWRCNSSCPGYEVIVIGARSAHCGRRFAPYNGPEQARVRVCEEVGV